MKNNILVCILAKQSITGPIINTCIDILAIFRFAITILQQLNLNETSVKNYQFSDLLQFKLNHNIGKLSMINVIKL